MKVEDFVDRFSAHPDFDQRTPYIIGSSVSNLIFEYQVYFSEVFSSDIGWYEKYLNIIKIVKS